MLPQALPIFWKRPIRKRINHTKSGLKPNLSTTACHLGIPWENSAPLWNWISFSILNLQVEWLSLTRLYIFGTYYLLNFMILVTILWTYGQLLTIRFCLYRSLISVGIRIGIWIIKLIGILCQIKLWYRFINFIKNHKIISYS